MTTNRKYIAGIAAGLALAIGGATALHAREQGPGGSGPGGGFGRGGPGGPGMRRPGGPGGPMGAVLPGLRGLELTDAQREQVRAVMESHKAEFEAQFQKLGPARKALHDAVTAEALDESAIRQRAADVAAIEADGAVLQARVHVEVWALLTPEQQQKARDLRAQMEQRRGQVRERIEQRRGQRQERRQQRQQRRG
jgi:periplasmic protein CpxP/Spy